MNAGPTTDRIHAALLDRIRSSGLPPGSRLDPIGLARELGTSPTPVRDALHILAGQGIIETRPSRGFATAAMNEALLVDLYGWMSEVLSLAIAKAPPKPPPRVPTDVNGNIAERAGQLFQQIANQSPNSEHRWAIARLNIRLHAARYVEATVLDDTENEWLRLEAAFHSGNGPELRRAIGRYVKRRKMISGQIVQSLYRGDYTS